MTDTNNQKPPEFVVPNNWRKYTRFQPPSNGRMWIVDGMHCNQGDLLNSPEAAEFLRKFMQGALTDQKKAGHKIGDPTCNVVELHVQTAEARAEQMRRLAEVIENAHFHSGYEQAYAASEIAEILGLDERWVNLATGVDPDECRDATDGPLTLGDVSDE